MTRRPPTTLTECATEISDAADWIAIWAGNEPDAAGGQLAPMADYLRTVADTLAGLAPE